MAWAKQGQNADAAGAVGAGLAAAADAAADFVDRRIVVAAAAELAYVIVGVSAAVVAVAESAAVVCRHYKTDQSQEDGPFAAPEPERRSCQARDSTWQAIEVAFPRRQRKGWTG